MYTIDLVQFISQKEIKGVKKETFKVIMVFFATSEIKEHECSKASTFWKTLHLK